MKALTFKRGIHPNDMKTTAEKKIEIIWPKTSAEIIYPMVQHLGAPCEPIIQVGDRVLIGQKIADSKAFMSSPVHASVSGHVKEFRKTLTPTGITCNAIIVENDGENEEIETMIPNKDFNSFSKEKIREIIKEAGIVGLGGAGFPFHIKITPPEGKKIDTIIVNASECEPYLTTDHRVLLEEADRLVLGLQIILKLFDGAKGIIAIETNKPDAIEHLNKYTKDISNIEIASLVPKYPQGSEKQLIDSCLRREVPSGGLPLDVGVIVCNVDTVIATHRAVVRGRPLMRKVVTVAGSAVNKPGNYKVRVGMKYSDLLEAIGGFKTQPKKMISGGPMMGVAMYDLDIPLVKTSSAFLCFDEKEAYIPPEKNCIRCGKCVEHCPMGLMPLVLNQNILFNEPDEFLKNNGMDCVECGSCSYICPSKRHLAQSIRATRRSILEERKRK